jgi:2-polyprenyl-3-methyl-5-hydroxy-6-metoxy-1,4-benzoquinol methylase
LKIDPRIAFFDQLAARWDSEGPPIQQTLARLESLRPRLGLEAGQNVLEVGCGTGQVTAWLAGVVRPGRVTAVDFSREMLERAKARGTEAEFKVADVCSEDLGHGRYDRVFCMHVFPHFREPAEALRRLSPALKPAGRLIVLHLLGRNEVNAVHGAAGGAVRHDRLLDPKDWPALLRDAGLRLVELTDSNDLFLLSAASAAGEPGTSQNHSAG